MSKALAYTGKELIRILQEFGFVVTRIRGSHHFLRHEDGRCTSVPVHGNECIGIGLMFKILKDCELSLLHIVR